MKDRLTAYSYKNIGGRDEQQDRVVHYVSSDTQRALLVVADGMGGHSGGARASSCIVAVTKNEWRESNEAKDISSKSILKNIFKFSYDSMNEFGRRENTSPRSTCVALVIKGDMAYYAHVGDSRLYHFRNGKLLSRTKDHSVVQMLADMEQIEEDDMATHEDQGRLLKWVGGKKEPDPTFAEVEIMAGDQFLLCSDGLWEHVKQQQMLNLLNKTNDLKKAAQLLVKWAKEDGGDKGDNISVALLAVNKKNKSTNWLLMISGVLLLIISFLAGYFFFSPEKVGEPLNTSHIQEAINNSSQVNESIRDDR